MLSDTVESHGDTSTTSRSTILSLLRTRFRPPRPMGCKRRRAGKGGRSGARITYVYGARESSRSFCQIMCPGLTVDTVLSLQRPEAPLYATHYLPCLTRCTDDATESGVSDKCCTCSTISVDAQVLRVADLLRCARRRASRRRLGRHARAHTPLLDICGSCRAPQQRSMIDL